MAFDVFAQVFALEGPLLIKFNVFQTLVVFSEIRLRRARAHDGEFWS